METTEDIVEHMELMHEDIQRKTRVRICPVCEYRSHQKVGFVYHMMVKHNDESYGTVQIYKCDKCEFQTPYACISRKHTKLVHGVY